MGEFLVYLGPVIGGLVIYAIIAAIITAPGQALRSKLLQLEPLKDRSKREIIQAAGQPRSISSSASGEQLLLWKIFGYYIVLAFDEDGICQGVIEEAGSREVVEQYFVEENPSVLPL